MVFIQMKPTVLPQMNAIAYRSEDEPNSEKPATIRMQPVFIR